MLIQGNKIERDFLGISQIIHLYMIRFRKKVDLSEFHSIRSLILFSSNYSFNFIQLFRFYFNSDIRHASITSSNEPLMNIFINIPIIFNEKFPHCKHIIRDLRSVNSV